MLLFSTSFVISVLFGDVKTEKIGSFCVTGRYNIEDLLPLFHNMLDCLLQTIGHVDIHTVCILVV